MREKFTDYLRFEKGYSVHTLKAYDSDLAYFETFISENFAVERAADADEVVLRSWVAFMMEEGLTAKSIRRRVSTVRTFFKWLMKYHGALHNPAAALALPKIPKRLPVYAEEAQMEALFPERVYPEGYAGLLDRTVIELLYHTGMRLAELTGLKKNAFDPEQGTLRVLGKRNKERILPVGNTLRNLLMSYEQARDLLPTIKDQACFFLTENGAKLYPKFVYRRVNHYLGSVSSLQKKSPHVLRHTFATHMLNRGADLNAIKEILGHASLAATQVYTHNSIEKLKEIHRKTHPKG